MKVKLNAITSNYQFSDEPKPRVYKYGICKDLNSNKYFVVIEQTETSLPSITNVIEDIATFIVQTSEELQNVKLDDILWFEHYPEKIKEWLYNFSQVEFDMEIEKDHPLKDRLKRILKIDESKRAVAQPQWIKISKDQIQLLNNYFELS